MRNSFITQHKVLRECKTIYRICEAKINNRKGVKQNNVQLQRSPEINSECACKYESVHKSTAMQSTVS